jgi:hypothetical protein
MEDDNHPNMEDDKHPDIVVCVSHVEDGSIAAVMEDGSHVDSDGSMVAMPTAASLCRVLADVVWCRQSCAYKVGLG